MPEDVGPDPAPNVTAVDRHRSLHGGQIQLRPVFPRLAEHAARSEEVVGNKGRGVERGVVGVAVFDDLDRGRDRRNRTADAVPPELG